MKKFSLQALFVLLTVASAAQTVAKKYLFIEHFTNTRCGICGSRNPQFYNTIKPYENDIHHISIHPSVPYASCVLYQHNPTDNEARRNYYGIVGTPTLVLNGKENTSGASLISTATIQAHLGKTSPLLLQLKIDGTANQRSVKVDAYSLGAIPSGNYRIFVMLAEKKLDYNAPNGEKVHYDVLRDILTAPAGDAFTPAASGGKWSGAYDFTMNPTWKADEIYALAFVQNLDNKDVLNSGSSRDPVTIASIEPADLSQIFISPNPASDLLRIQSSIGKIHAVQIFNIAGKLAVEHTAPAGNSFEIPIHLLPSGCYLLKISTSSGVYSSKFLKH